MKIIERHITLINNNGNGVDFIHKIDSNDIIILSTLHWIDNQDMKEVKHKMVLNLRELKLVLNYFEDFMDE